MRHELEEKSFFSMRILYHTYIQYDAGDGVGIVAWPLGKPTDTVRLGCLDHVFCGHLFCLWPTDPYRIGRLSCDMTTTGSELFSHPLLPTTTIILNILFPLQDKEIEPEGVIYKLVSNVCHIKDNSLGSTLVSQILVSKKFHERKAVRN